MLGRVAKPAFANIILWSAFTSMSMWQYVDESQGSKIGTAQEPPATSPPSLRGPQPRDVDALGWAKTLWAVQILTLRRIWGVRNPRTGHHKSVKPFLRLHLQRETCRNGCGKTTSMIPLIIFVFGEFGSPVCAKARTSEKRAFIKYAFFPSTSNCIEHILNKRTVFCATNSFCQNEHKKNEQIHHRPSRCWSGWYWNLRFKGFCPLTYRFLIFKFKFKRLSKRSVFVEATCVSFFCVPKNYITSSTSKWCSKLPSGNCGWF